MTFEAMRAIMEILFVAEERLIDNQAFYILNSIIGNYLIEWGWWEVE